MKPLQNFIRQITKYGFEPLFKRYYSRYPARVTNNKDESGLQQLCLHIPILHQRGTSQWVKGYGVPAGNNYGLQSLPQIGDYVFVTFEHGDARSPRWNYGWYANGEKPEEFEDENVHGFKSPGGHSVLIDDTNNQIKVTMKDGKTFMINEEVIELNGNNLGGLVMVDGTLNKFNQLEDKVNNLITKFNSHTHLYIAPSIPLPGPPVPTAPIITPETPIVPTTVKSDLENEKIKHGDN